MKKVFSDKIRSYLLAEKLIDESKLASIEKKAQKKKIDFEEAIVQSGLFGEQEFAGLKGKIFNIEVADLSGIKITADSLNILPAKVAKNYQMLVFDRAGQDIKVGMVDPGNLQAHEAIEFLVQQQGLKATYYAISLEDFKDAMEGYSGFKKEIGTAMHEAEVEFSQKEDALDISDEIGSDISLKSAPVAKIVSVIIKHAVDGGASDIHIEPSRGEARVRYRVDGVLKSSLTLPKYVQQAVISRIKVLAGLKLDETRIPQDGRIMAEVDGQEIDLRVSVLPMLDAEKIVMRVLDTSAGVPNLVELGFIEKHIEIIKRNMKKPHGLFLLTGPTGSGKTTTLYSVLNDLNSEDSNITTLEDPVEYYIPGINQSQIRTDIGYTFAKGLRAILRQDPNIVMVGEIRDKETAELVIHAALTGHLVFSTLHTNDAKGAIPRLIDMGAEAFLLSSTLNLILAQRLIRKVCQKCKEEIKLPKATQKKVDAAIAKIPEEYLVEFNGKIKFYQGKGCSECGNTGYSGRSVVAEIIEVGRELKDIVAEDFTDKDIIEQLDKQGFISLTQDGLLKAMRGITTVEEVLRVSQI